MELYRIKPRMKVKWLFSKGKVYDVIKHYEKREWVDPTYGNGGGEFITVVVDEVIETFNTYMEADTFKTELER